MKRLKSVPAIFLALCASNASSSDTSLITLQSSKESPSLISSALGRAEEGRWRVGIEMDAIRAIRGPDGRVAKLSSAPALGTTIVIGLPDALEVSLTLTGITEVVPGVMTLTGVLSDDSGKAFSLSVTESTVLGSIQQGEFVWLIEPNGSEHSLRKVRRGAMAAVKEDLLRAEPRGKIVQPKGASQKTGGAGRVDVLFLYANDVDSPSSRASDIVSRFNTILSNSAVSSNNYITSAGVVEIDDDFAGQTRYDIIYDMNDRLAPFDTLMSDLMFDAKADMAFLIVDEDSTVLNDVGAYGRVGGIAYLFSDTSPFAVSTKTYALGDNTAAHEIGHVLDGLHEDATTGINRPKIQSSCDWMTVMGGYLTCTFDGLPATTERISYFSNPSLSYGGESLGVTSVSDMESHLESTMPTASSWRDSGDPSAPPVSSSITKSPGYCYGLNDISWASATGATEYRLYESASSGFSSPSVVYTGSSASTSVSVPTSSTRYYRARACNGQGCSNFTTQVQASWFNGCL